VQAVAAQQAAEAQARLAQGAAAQSEQDKTVLREQLRTQLNVILETRETARGLIVNLSDVLFDTASSTLKPGAREKLARVSGILVRTTGCGSRSRGTRQRRYGCLQSGSL
jgi:outer membrane protein OmpA-like peptidoglycan-associated protein